MQKRKPVCTKAVIFDFNGTLFDDTDFHNQAWTEFFRNHGIHLTRDNINNKIHGFTNREILERFLKRSLTYEEHSEFYEEKENIYRQICHLKKELCVLTKGSAEFLDYLNITKIPRTIATASYLTNVKMYFEMFSLSRWFDLSKVVYDSGEFRGKPNPDMYLAASENLGVHPGECMIIEDSKSGVEAAKNAGAGIIIAVSFNNDHEKFRDYGYIDQIIDDFTRLKHYFS